MADHESFKRPFFFFHFSSGKEIVFFLIAFIKTVHCLNFSWHDQRQFGWLLHKSIIFSNLVLLPELSTQVKIMFRSPVCFVTGTAAKILVITTLQSKTSVGTLVKCDIIWIHCQLEDNQGIFFIIRTVSNLDTKIPPVVKLWFISWKFISALQSWNSKKHKHGVASAICITSFWFQYYLKRFTWPLYALTVMMHSRVRTCFRDTDSEMPGNIWSAACWHST